MEPARTLGRGVGAREEKVYTDAYEKENRLRLKWFRKNEDRLVSFTEKPNVKSVPPEILQNMTNERKAHYQEVEKFPLRIIDDALPRHYDPAAIKNIMKPVDPITNRLIYTGSNKDGRKNYLTQRYKILPENRYYFPETSTFVYGWNMWNSSKTCTPVRYGLSQVIQRSFYRRNNVAKDPDWYQEPAVLSPDVCRCT